jgi:cyclopropane fatty-acyl-phospholipid synthase-like methyltransferase
MWTNLGFWDAAVMATKSGPPRYRQAAAELARRVGVAAGLKAGDVVVDYACGFGDSLRLWIEEFGAARVIGVEPDPSICREIEARVAAWGLGDRIHVVCRAAEDATAEAAQATAIVCVDAAYHFRTRRDWLIGVGEALPAGARLGFADLCVYAGNERSPSLRALARIMRIPHQNLLSARSLAMACEDAGFSVGSCAEVGGEVLDGFVAQAPRGAFSVATTRAAIAFARRARLLDYLVIGATR